MHLLLIVWLVLLAGCGGGEETVMSSATTRGVTAVSTYTGPAPATSDVQAFKLNVWDNLNPDNRCGGSCHVAGGIAPTPFVRSDDINLAYAEAVKVVDLVTPDASTMVSKVAGGHNCWLGSGPAEWQACADIITTWISNWAGNTAGTGNEITLVAPSVLLDPGSSKHFPADPGLFAATVHPELVENCAGCHADSAQDAQSPFFANSDPDSAYAFAKSKMDLNNPANSRFVLRLREEFHNCWDPNGTGSTDCAASATVMENAITAFAGAVLPDSIPTGTINSKALTLPDGIIASGGNRFEDHVIALYQFKEGSGNTAFDTSGIAPAMDLTLSGDLSWVGGWGIQINSGRAQALTSTSRKLHDQIKASGEYTIEAWVVPANVSQDNSARIASYSSGTGQRNFTLGQTLYSYDFLQRTSLSDLNGMPVLTTDPGDEDLQATLQHVVLTYDPANGRRIYVNGVFTGDTDPDTGGNLTNWDSGYAFVLGNETSGDRQWQGTIRFLAVHNRALTGAQIQQNYDVGVGEKFFLLFNVDAWSGLTDSYVLIEASQFDSYSYLFNAPRFVVLDPAAAITDFPIAGMRIGMNGKEVTVGQAYRNLDTVISTALYTAGYGQPLSDLGTVFAQEQGPEGDEFFLTFEVFGSATNITTEPAPLAAAPPPDLPEASVVGLRTFEEINATMAAVTGVSSTQPGVAAVYRTVQQQLPTVELIEGFLSAHQMAIAQLAIEYCSALVDDNGTITRASYFPGFFTGAAPEPANTAFDTPAKRNQVIQPLLTRIMNTGLTVQPDPAAAGAELDSLLTILTACATGPTPSCATTQRTVQVVKGICAATLGSAVMLLQ